MIMYMLHANFAAAAIGRRCERARAQERLVAAVMPERIVAKAPPWMCVDHQQRAIVDQSVMRGSELAELRSGLPDQMFERLGRDHGGGGCDRRGQSEHRQCLKTQLRQYDGRDSDAEQKGRKRHALSRQDEQHDDR
ncbi:hypothetical protein GCM10023158_18250 [Gluconacetobacter tumulicola]